MWRAKALLHVSINSKFFNKKDDVHHTYGKVGLFLYTSLKSHISMENLTINNFLLKIIDIFAIMFEVIISN